MAQPLNQHHLKQLNQCLGDLCSIKADLDQANNAGVPNLEPFFDRFKYCQERVEALKKTYFKGKK
jgi:hypothetical protein